MIVTLLFILIFEIFAVTHNNVRDYCADYRILNLLKNYWEGPRGKSYWKEVIVTSLNRGDTYALYNTQINTINLIQGADGCGFYDYINDLVDVYLTAYDYLVSTDVYKVNMSGFFEYFTLSPPSKMWIHNNALSGTEIVLNSAQFLSAIVRLIYIIEKIPEFKRTYKMREFVDKYYPVVLDHYKRWVLGEGIFQVRGWGCNPKLRYNHFDFIKKKLNREFYPDANLAHITYCNLATDIDLFIIYGVVELVYLNKKNSDKYFIDLFTRSSFDEYISISTNFIINNSSQVIILNDFKGKKVEGLIFGGNDWYQYPDMAYSCYTGESFPNNDNICRAINTSWDISHARRLVHIFTGLYEKGLLGRNMIMRLSNQILYKVFDGDFLYPKFSNYLGGANGWYRVNYNNRPGFGYAPYDLSISIPTGGYFFLSKYDLNFIPLRERLLEIFLSNNPEEINFRERYYGSYYQDYQRTLPSFSLSTSSVFLMFLPTFFPIGEKKEVISLDLNKDEYYCDMPFGDLKIKFPYEVLSKNKKVYISEKNWREDIYLNDRGIEGSFYIESGIVFEINISEGLTNTFLNDKIKIDLVYNDKIIRDNYKDKIGILFKDNFNSGYKFLNVEKISENEIVFYTNEFGVFKLVYLNDGIIHKKDDIIIFPNPVFPKHTNLVSFFNITPNSFIYIYSLSGNLIVKIMSDSNGMASWDMKDSFGKIVSSGLYFVVDKKTHKKGKFIIEK